MNRRNLLNKIAMGWVGLFLTLGLLTLNGCSIPLISRSVDQTAPASPPNSPPSTKDWVKDLESRLKIRSIPEVSRYLGELADKMKSEAGLSLTRVEVKVIRDRGGQWMSYAGPGERIYLSQGILQTVEFENELAAAMAIEMGHLVKQHFQRQVALGKREYFGAAGIFAYTVEENSEAIEEAVRILYLARFDPRGLLSLLERFQKNPKRSPYPANGLKALREQAYNAIGSFAPLLNPIVRSAQFLELQKRMHKL